jgi:predicted transcriptional regulator
MKHITVPMPAELANYFQRKAQAEDRSVSSAIRVALSEYMKREAGRQAGAAA